MERTILQDILIIMVMGHMGMDLELEDILTDTLQITMLGMVHKKIGTET